MTERKVVSPDISLTEERIAELEQPVMDEQFAWLEEHGLLDNGMTYKENRRAFVPFSEYAVCWCQPFGRGQHPKCPMHADDAQPPTTSHDAHQSSDNQLPVSTAKTENSARVSGVVQPPNGWDSVGTQPGEPWGFAVSADGKTCNSIGTTTAPAETIPDFRSFRVGMAVDKCTPADAERIIPDLYALAQTAANLSIWVDGRPFAYTLSALIGHFQRIGDEQPQWSGAPDPTDPDNFWIDDATGERVNAHTGERTAPPVRICQFCEGEADEGKACPYCNRAPESLPFSLVNLDADATPTCFATLEEAFSGAKFDRLTRYEIWEGDTLRATVEATQ